MEPDRNKVLDKDKRKEREPPKLLLIDTHELDILNYQKIFGILPEVDRSERIVCSVKIERQPGSRAEPRGIEHWIWGAWNFLVESMAIASIGFFAPGVPRADTQTDIGKEAPIDPGG